MAFLKKGGNGGYIYCSQGGTKGGRSLHTNLKQVAEDMAKGDTAFFDGTRLIRIIPGSIGSMLTTHDFGNDPTWSY